MVLIEARCRQTVDGFDRNASIHGFASEHDPVLTICQELYGFDWQPARPSTVRSGCASVCADLRLDRALGDVVLVEHDAGAAVHSLVHSLADVRD